VELGFAFVRSSLIEPSLSVIYCADELIICTPIEHRTGLVPGTQHNVLKTQDDEQIKLGSIVKSEA